MAVEDRPEWVTNPSDFDPENDNDILANIAKNAEAVTGIAANKNILVPLALRERMRAKEGDKPSDSAVKDESEQLAAAEAMLADLNKLVDSVLGRSVLECLRNGGPLRGAFEVANPQQQCSAVILNVELGTTPCWICGTVIPDMSATEAEVHARRGAPPGDIRKHPLSPECEHIFPIAQALCFTGLYEHELFASLKKDPAIPTNKAAYIAGLRKEYRWAHRICNQVKNDTHFIKIVANRFVYDPPVANALITAILASTEYQWPPLPNTKKGEKDMFTDATGWKPQAGWEIRQQGKDIIGEHLARYVRTGRNEWINERVEELRIKTDDILREVAHKTAGEHAAQTVADFQAYAVHKKCAPVKVNDAIPNAMWVQPTGSMKVYPDYFTDDYCNKLMRATIDKITPLFEVQLQETINAGGRDLLKEKWNIIERIHLLATNLDQVKHASFRLNKRGIASYILNNGKVKAEDKYQTYQKVYYILFLAETNYAAWHVVLHGQDPAPDDLTGKAAFQTLTIVFDKEAKKYDGFLQELLGPDVNAYMLRTALPDSTHDKQLKLWSLPPASGGRTRRRGKRAPRTRRRRKLPKLL